jgi:hypothetical protein
MKSYKSLLAVAVMAALIAPAIGQDSTTMLQRNLDRPVKLSVANLTIGEVFEKLSAETGVRFILDSETLAYLPYGNQTRLAVTIPGVTLRNALSPMLAPQALQWSIEGDAVRISPSEALYRMCRRATYDELLVLGKLHTGKLAPSQKGELAAQVKDVIGQIKLVAEDKDLDLAFQTSADSKDAAYARAMRALPGGPVQWLDALTGADWTWYLHGDQIIVLDRKKQIERQLQKQVSFKYQNEAIPNVLLDLANKARVQLAMDPGVIQLLPPDTRNNFNLVMSDATVAQALGVISGATGLVFTRTNDGILVEAGKLALAAAATQPVKRPSFFLRVPMQGPGGANLEMYIRADDLPDDLRAVLEGEKTQFIQKLREQYVHTPESMPSDNSEKGFESPAK